MIIDTSALMAILGGEAEVDAFIELLLAADRVRIAAPTLVEVRIVAAERRLSAELAELLDLAAVEVEPFDEGQAELAVGAFEKYGKGRHPAALNYGDCFAYAAALALDEPLLFKGNDFSKTDVRSAVTGSSLT